MNRNSFLWTSVVIILSLFADLCLYGFFEQPVSWFLGAYCLIALIMTRSQLVFLALACMLALESTLLYGNAGMVLLYTMPLVLVARSIMQVINAPLIMCALCASGAMGAQLHLINPYILGHSAASMQYTMVSIAVTLIGAGLFCLKFQKR